MGNGHNYTETVENFIRRQDGHNQLHAEEAGLRAEAAKERAEERSADRERLTAIESTIAHQAKSLNEINTAIHKIPIGYDGLPCVPHGKAIVEIKAKQDGFSNQVKFVWGIVALMLATVIGTAVTLAQFIGAATP